MDQVSRIVLGVLLLVAGLAYAGYRLLADFAGDPDEGPLGGFGPLIAGLAVAALGIIVLIF